MNLRSLGYTREKYISKAQIVVTYFLSCKEDSNKRIFVLIQGSQCKCWRIIRRVQ